MTTRAVLAALAFATASFAQAPPPLPQRGASPLLFVRFEGKARVAFYQGRAPARSFDAPVAVGLRPGYVYRMRIDKIEGHPDLAVYPTIEVHGCLMLPARLTASSFPLPLRLTADDYEAIQAGSVVTKVHYLEHPDKAEPRQTKEGQPLEFEVDRKGNPWQQARERGRIMLVMHFGPKQPTAEELAAINVPGTILFPDQKVVGPAAAPPHLMMAYPKFMDPKTGMRKPEEECLHDGGIRNPLAGFDSAGKLYGIGPEDTVAEWTDSRGRRHLTPSNRICVCAPRFVALRKEVPLALAEGFWGPLGAQSVRSQEQVNARQPVKSHGQFDRLRGYTGRMRPGQDTNTTAIGTLKQIKVLDAANVTLGLAELLGSQKLLTLRKDEHLVLNRQLALVRQFSNVTTVAGTEQIIGTAVAARVKAGAEVVETVLSVRDLTVCCESPGPLPLDRPLQLVKCADKSAAQVGDEITFTLKYTNGGMRPLTDVAVTDSLSGRLEYVAGSSMSDREAVFSMRENEAGSAVLRWEVGGTLQPGESGRVKFKVRVR